MNTVYLLNTLPGNLETTFLLHGAFIVFWHECKDNMTLEASTTHPLSTSFPNIFTNA